MRHLVQLDRARNMRILRPCETSAEIPSACTTRDRHRRPHGRVLPGARAVSRAGGPLARPSLAQRLLPPYGGTDAPWHEQTPAERAATRTPRGPWWSSPAKQTIDLATALFPELLYERLDELGFDFSVVYPSLGLVFLHTPDEHVPPRHMPRAQPVQRRDVRAASPTAWPGRRDPDAHARTRRSPSSSTRSTTLGFKAVLLRRLRATPVRRARRQATPRSPLRVLARPVRHRLAYDYDPVWAKAQELGVSRRVPLRLHRA